jgi:hypothetical protein
MTMGSLSTLKSAGPARRWAGMLQKPLLEVDETPRNPLISPTFKRIQRCRAPDRQGTVSRYALRYPFQRAAEFGAAERLPG